MKTRAAVLRAVGQPFEITEIELDEPKAGEVTGDPLADATAVRVLIAGCDVVAHVGFVISVAHAALPNKYTTVNTAIQMMSRACQNSAKQRMRR